jgi:hypothetical protein
MAIRTEPSPFPVRSAGAGITPPTDYRARRPVMSSTLLADTVDLMRLLERRLEGRHCQEPGSALAAIDRLEAWARARPWEVPSAAVEKADRLLQTAEHAYSTIAAAGWIESLPDEILALIDRRRPGYVTDRPAEGLDDGGFERLAPVPVPRRRSSDR